ncbi:hypothetical protein ACHAXR_007651 [Thalassiosira sp. AJA248-18]
MLEKHAAFANQLADAARKEIQPYWRQSRHALGQQIKVEDDRSVFQSASPVTLADRAAEHAMRELITEQFPDHGIIGEEYGVKDEDADWVWVLDPVDGTRSFITGKPLFGTLISLLYKGNPVIGIIDQCILNERWLGISGQESTLNGRPIKTDGVGLLSDAEMYSTTPDMFRHGDELCKFDAMRGAVRTPHYGADCYAYALVASGFGADIVVEADLGLFDYCALVPVIEGAGGVITDWKGNNLTLSNHESSKGRVLASANSLLHSQALEILNTPPAAISNDGILMVRPDDDELLAVLGDASKQSNSNVSHLICGVMLGEMIAHYGP